MQCDMYRPVFVHYDNEMLRGVLGMRLPSHSLVPRLFSAWEWGGEGTNIVSKCAWKVQKLFEKLLIWGINILTWCPHFFGGVASGWDSCHLPWTGGTGRRGQLSWSRLHQGGINTSWLLSLSWLLQDDYIALTSIEERASGEDWNFRYFTGS